MLGGEAGLAELEPRLEMRTTTPTKSRYLRLAAAIWLLPLLAGCLPGGSEGGRLYKRHCSTCHGIDGGGGIKYLADEGANLLDDAWKYGGERGELEYTMAAELVFEHPTLSLTSQEIVLLVDHIQALRGE